MGWNYISIPKFQRCNTIVSAGCSVTWRHQWCLEPIVFSIVLSLYVAFPKSCTCFYALLWFSTSRFNCILHGAFTGIVSIIRLIWSPQCQWSTPKSTEKYVTKIHMWWQNRIKTNHNKSVHSSSQRPQSCHNANLVLSCCLEGCRYINIIKQSAVQPVTNTGAKTVKLTNALEVVMITTSSAVSDEMYVNMTTFSFQWNWYHGNSGISVPSIFFKHTTV